MEHEQQDYDDATADQHMQDERARREEFSAAGGTYTDYVRTLANTGNISWHLHQ